MRRILDKELENYVDEDVSKSFAWFRSFFRAGEWAERRARVETHVEHVLMSGYGLREHPEEEFLRMNFDKDKIVWYLYLLDTCLHDIACYESVAGARILPIFKRIGEHIDEVKAIDGINKKVRKLIQNHPTQADTVLFEILTALLWVTNGYNVCFLPEKSEKQPDLKAVKNDKEWYIECKRLTKASVYADKEKDRWLKMFSHLKSLPQIAGLVLEVIFHVELSGLKETFLVDLLKTKLKKKPKAGLLLSNSRLTIRIAFVDYKKIDAHLVKFCVKNPSPQMCELIGGRRDDNFGFTHGAMVNNIRWGSGIGNNIFAEELKMAYGVYWKCDAPEAIFAKARDILGNLKSAIQQLPSVRNSVIHIGIETYDGPKVEEKRFEKINATMENLEIRSQNLAWVYCHFFQSYSLPDQIFVYDESLVRFNNVIMNIEEPLDHTTMIVPWKDSEKGTLHWLKPQP